MTDLERRIDRLESRASIMDLAARYFIATDVDDTESVMACFAADASFLVSGQLCGEGSDNIRDFLVSARSGMGMTVHVHKSSVVDFEGPDQATGVVTAHLELVLQDVPVYGAVRYHDRYARRDGAWKIIFRDMKVVYLAEWADAPRALSSTTPVRWPGAPEGPSDIPRP